MHSDEVQMHHNGQSSNLICSGHSRPMHEGIRSCQPPHAKISLKFRGTKAKSKGIGGNYLDDLPLIRAVCNGVSLYDFKLAACSMQSYGP